MGTTLKDIATRAGFSVSTVSRVINNKSELYRISKKTRDLILHLADEMNYRPNNLARGLRLKKTHTLGLIIPNISNPFFAHVASMIQTSAYQSGYSLIVCNTDEDLDKEIEQIELLRSKGVDGFIIMPVGVRFNHIVQLLEANIPLVLLDRCIEEIDTNSVVVDNEFGAYQAVEHLIHNGHTHIAIIQGIPNTFTSANRLQGYKSALSNYNISIQENLIAGKDFTKESGYIETKFLLNLDKPPTAIFTTSDLITLGSLEAIFEEKFNIPEDISIVSFDDIDFAPYLISPLTAVHQPKKMMGEIAVKLLIEDIENKGRRDIKRIVLQTHLIVRKSVRNIREKVEKEIQILSH